MDDKVEHDVAVILVGLNARQYVHGCLNSLQEAEWRGISHELIYVDNASTDGSVSMVRDEFSDVKVIANSQNLGFCKAANQGAALANSRYLMFVNDDTLVLDDAVPLAVEFMEAAPSVGAVGSRLLYGDLTEQWSARRFPTILNALFGRRSLLHRFFPNVAPVSRYLYKRELAGSQPFEVDWVSAAGVMFRREPFQQVGGFAEDYYYWHEIVISDRLRRHGHATFMHPESKIIHFEGKGSGPRPYRVRRFHIINFHHGAYRCYCEHFDLDKASPRRWLVALGLGARAGLLLGVNWISTIFSESLKPGKSEREAH